MDNSDIWLFQGHDDRALILTFGYSRDMMIEPGDSLSSTLAGLRESYYDYNMSVKQNPEHGEI